MSEDKLSNSCEDSKLTRLGSKILANDDCKTITASVDSNSYRSLMNDSNIALAKQISVCSTDEEKDYFEVPTNDYNFPISSINNKLAERGRKILGVDEDEMKRNKALISLGVTHSDAIEASKLMKSLPTPTFTKEEKLTGYTLTQIKRQKALELLGSTEEVLADDVPKTLSSMGVRIVDKGTRRRSIGQPLRRGLSVPVFGSLTTELRKMRAKESPDVSLYGAKSSTQSSQRSKV